MIKLTNISKMKSVQNYRYKTIVRKILQTKSYSSETQERNILNHQTNDTNPETKNVTIEKYQSITIVNINNVSRRNSLNLEILNEITKAFDDFDKDNNAHVLVLNGEYGVFCSGFDLQEVQEKGYSAMAEAAKRFTRQPLCHKPTIASVAGYAVAEGFELALACDLRVVEDTACLGFLGRRFGLTGNAMNGMSRLAIMIGLSRALEIIMTGKLITGTVAETFGIANRKCCTGNSLGDSIKLAKEIAKFPQSALIADKLEALNAFLDSSSDDRLRNEAVMASLTGNIVEDIKVGVEKFKQGIGKHGKATNLTDLPKKDWEIQEEKLRKKKKLDT